MIFGNKRSELEIVYQILSLAQSDIKKTRLMYQTNLCYSHFLEYMDYLMEKEFLDVKYGNPVGRVYYTTEKGQQLLQHISTVLNDIRAES